MIDLHCHILPNVDDGAHSLEDSLAMADVAVKNGITHILCTPHHNNGTYTNPKNSVIRKVAHLQKELDARGIPLTLYEGQEVRITGDLMDEIKRKRILFADITNHYLLIEFPTAEVPAYTDRVFFELLSSEVTPVIVHPERNAYFMEDPNRLIPFIEMGVLTQMTAPSYVGGFGKKIERIAQTMVKHNLIHMVASDAHNTDKRTFLMKEAYQAIAQKCGQAQVDAMKKVTIDIINGENVVVPTPEYVKKSTLFFL